MYHSLKRIVWVLAAGALLGVLAAPLGSAEAPPKPVLDRLAQAPAAQPLARSDANTAKRNAVQERQGVQRQVGQSKREHVRSRRR